MPGSDRAAWYRPNEAIGFRECPHRLRKLFPILADERAEPLASLDAQGSGCVLWRLPVWLAGAGSCHLVSSLVPVAGVPPQYVDLLGAWVVELAFY